ncbi:MAG TPA: hypothetical protein VFS20_17715 [Longimicrobium sp.]|nr:hypothetical protein [Longimicrobium sp.]
MRKLKLNLDELRVDSFAPQKETEPADGTVHGHQETWPFRCTMFCTYNCTGIPCFRAQPRG